VRLQPVVIHRKGDPSTDYDDYGNPVPNADTDIAAYAYRVSPSSGREISQGQQTQVIVAAGVFPPATPIRAQDEMTASGRRYRVVGVFPVPGRDPNTVHHLRADLEAAE
jgi:hypothetical protein